jgi:ubiquinone/menaquinone biosynthesis C-methylase UbiE
VIVNDFIAFGDRERSHWSDRARAANYVRLFAPASDQAIDSLLDAAGVKPGLKALDLCCGQGNVARALISRGCQVVGVDFSPAMLAFARERAPHASFIEADAQDLPFDDAEFDVIVSNFGMSHIADQLRALAEVRRVLTPSGCFAMTVWCGPDVSPCMDVVYSTLKVHSSRDVSLPPAPDFLQFARRELAEKLILKAGFSSIDFTIVDCAWDLDSPERLFEIFEKGSFRAAMLLAGQPPDNVAAIRSAMAEAVRQRFRTGTRWRVPMPAALLRATPSSMQVDLRRPS